MAGRERGRKRRGREKKKRGAKVWFGVLNIFCHPVPVGGPSSFQRFSSERGLDINILNEGWTRGSGQGVSSGVAGGEGKTE